MTSNVKRLMNSKDITIRELMKKTGLANQTILKARDHRIESCSLRTLAIIAQALGCKLKDLFDE